MRLARLPSLANRYELMLLRFSPQTIPNFRRWSREKLLKLCKTLSAPSLNAVFNAWAICFASSLVPQTTRRSSELSQTTYLPPFDSKILYSSTGTNGGIVMCSSSSPKLSHARENASPLLFLQRLHFFSFVARWMYSAGAPQSSVLHLINVLIWVEMVQKFFIWLKSAQILSTLLSIL